MRALPWILLLVAGTAHANVVGVLERGVSLAGKAKAARSVSFRTPHATVTLDADRNIIGLDHALHRRAYFLHNGKLSAPDRQELGKILEQQEGLTRQGATENVRSALTARRVEARRLALADPQIDRFLELANSDKSERTLYSGLRGEVKFLSNGHADMFIVGRGVFGQRAIFLNKSAQGTYSLLPDDRASVARLVLAP